MRISGGTGLHYLPVALLTVGILVHAVQIEVADEDPQSGSAFAMFATVDVAATRRVVASVPGAPPTRLEVPPDLANLRTRLTEAPADATARRLAKELLARSWEVHHTTARVGGHVKFDQVDVAVFGIDVNGWSLSRRMLAKALVASDH